MKIRPARLGSAQSLVALSVSLAVVLSSGTCAFASLAKSGGKSPATKTLANQKQTDSPQSELRLISATATATADGVLLQWHTNSAPDNLGFNVYRLKAGQRTRVNKEIIPGAVFAPGAPGQVRGGYSYAWFDRGGSADATYYIESVSLRGIAKTHEPFSPVISKTASGFEQTPDALSGASAAESTDSFEKYYPAAEVEINSPQGALEDQWAIAAQSALKIAIRKDGWYRVTQPQMVAAGFNPTVDIRNLRLFVDAKEVAISTNQLTGSFGSGDYIEFYGRGLDIPTTDTRIYYLIGGTTPGKRVRGEIQLDGDPILPPAPTSTPRPASTTGPVLHDPIFFSWAQRDLFLLMESLRPSSTPVMGAPGENNNSPAGNSPLANAPYVDSQPGDSAPEQTAGADGRNQAAGAERGPRAGSPRGVLEGRSRQNAITSAAVAPVAAIKTTPRVETRSLTLPVLTKPLAANASAANKMGAARKFHKGRVSKKRKRNRVRRAFKQERNHAELTAGFAPANFDYTLERKDRGVYLSNLINGDAENWFGNVISVTPVTQTLTVPNPDLSAIGPATLEFALQGVMSQFGFSHSVNVTFNGTLIDSLNFGPLEHPVRTVSIPIALLQSGANTLTFTKTSTGEVCIVDYVRLTYPHAFRADAGSLKFSLRGTVSLQVDGFSTPSVRLIDYTDPLNVGIMRPASEPSGPGFAITVPRSDPPSKPPRLLYAIADGQFDQPAGLALSQPSTLNLNSNTGDFLIISHKTFIPSFSANVSPINTSLVAQRQSQGMTVSVVDIDDVYDEFSYGVHGPQAIRDFLLHASTQWAAADRPRYVIFAGDASHDPRNYQGSGNFDLVPTKLVDATFNETASDDWLTDFDNDQIANIPVGRLPVRVGPPVDPLAEASLVISKIVNFTPLTPQSAMLVADDPTGYFFNFETANDEVQALLPGSMTVQRVNVRIDGPALAKTNVIAGFNQGRALVNYSGHGNVNVWSSSSIFFSSDATALTNGNNLSFVVVMDCLNGYFQDPVLLSLSEAFLKAPGGGAVAAFASSGLTFPDGQHQMSEQLYTLIYGAGAQPIALGDAIKIAKAATTDVDVRSTWVFFGDPSLKIR